MELLFLAGIPAIIGIIVGTQIALIWQVCLVIGALAYFNSAAYKNLELAGIMPFIVIVFFFIGVIVGDISWIIQTGAWHDWDIKNPFVASV